MRFLKLTLLLIFIFSLIYAFYTFKKNNNILEEKFNSLSKELEKLQKENEQLKENIEYFKIKENLLKELKKQYNYKESGENLIIIIPRNESNTRP